MEHRLPFPLQQPSYRVVRLSQRLRLYICRILFAQSHSTPRLQQRLGSLLQRRQFRRIGRHFRVHQISVQPVDVQVEAQHIDGAFLLQELHESVELGLIGENVRFGSCGGTLDWFCTSNETLQKYYSLIVGDGLVKFLGFGGGHNDQQVDEIRIGDDVHQGEQRPAGEEFTDQTEKYMTVEIVVLAESRD